MLNRFPLCITSTKLKIIWIIYNLILADVSLGQNKINSRLFYSKPQLYNSKSRITHFDLSAYEVVVSLPTDNRNKFYGETVYKNIKTHELEEFFESPTMVEVQNKLNFDLKKFKANRHPNSQNKLLISPSVEAFYPKVHGFIKGKSYAKVRLEISTALNGSMIFTKKYEELYVTNGMDNEFEGDITMTIEEGENVTLGMALRKVLDQFYFDLNKILSLGKNQVLLSGLVVNSKTSEGVVGKISFNSDSLSVTSTSDGKFELILPRKRYQLLIVASNFINLSEPFDLASSELRMVQSEFRLKPVEKGTVVSLKNVLFYMGTTNLLESSYAELDAVVSFLKSSPRVKIELNGHTDNQGSAQKDLVLSQDRVDKIRAYLISKGVSGKRITGKGFGGTKPIASNVTEEGRSQNRRVEFVIIKN
jgi:outer membrane protein OmpA-like peptidoglycan-associated protein